MSESRLYDEFFEWLDTKVPPIKIPTLFPELEGFEMPISAFLAQVKKSIYRGDGYYDQYLDILFEVWFRQRGKL